jgi:hypothetical protein
LALTLPDICGKLQDPKTGSETRYRAWWDKYLLAKYAPPDAPLGIKFLTSGDVYALRCSYLHEGGDNISNQRVQEALTNFMFIEPPGGGNIRHINRIIQTDEVGGRPPHDTLQLQVDLFCNDICEGVDKWIEDTKDDVNVMERLKSLLTIKVVTRRASSLPALPTTQATPQ